MVCEICGIEVKSYGSLAQHVNKTHNTTSTNYYIKYIGEVGCCAVCKEPTTFVNISKGYRECCSFECSGVLRRRRLKDNTLKHKQFTEKVSNNMKSLWVNGDTTVRVNKITKTRKETLINMTSDERKEKFGWLNNVPIEDRQDYINKLTKPLFDWYDNASGEDKENINDKIRRTRLGDRYDIDVMGEFVLYRGRVRCLTEKTYRNHKDTINPEGYIRSRGSDGWQLDHKFSIVEGFKEKIRPEIMSSITNLQMLSSLENNKKNTRCDILKDELLGI